MAFVVETGTGSSTATAYCTVQFFRDFCEVEGLDLTGIDDTAIELALQRATRYMDYRYSFVGYRLNDIQRLQWPRSYAYYRDGRVALDVPREVQECSAFLAFRSLSARLAPDPTYDESGAKVLRKAEQVGPISQELEFANGGALATMRKYPEADQLIRCLTTGGGELLRA